MYPSDTLGVQASRRPVPVRELDVRDDVKHFSIDWTITEALKSFKSPSFLSLDDKKAIPEAISQSHRRNTRQGMSRRVTQPKPVPRQTLSDSLRDFDQPPVSTADFFPPWNPSSIFKTTMQSSSPPVSDPGIRDNLFYYDITSNPTVKESDANSCPKIQNSKNVAVEKVQSGSLKSISTIQCAQRTMRILISDLDVTLISLQNGPSPPKSSTAKNNFLIRIPSIEFEPVSIHIKKAPLFLSGDPVAFRQRPKPKPKPSMR
jgi:hypothetical protein